jgi:hypothetical protein
MRLLVSVRSAEEALAALAGADIVDAKGLARGSLGRDGGDARDRRPLPPTIPLSVALGDFEERPLQWPAWRPFGPGGTGLPQAGIRRRRGAATDPKLHARCGQGTGRPALIVAAAYADFESARAADCDDRRRAASARRACCSAQIKDGRPAGECPRLRGWINDARAAASTRHGSLSGQALAAALWRRRGGGAGAVCERAGRVLGVGW